jgi:hypothetical protein
MSDLVAGIYAAVEDASLWEGVLAEFTQKVRSSMSHFWIVSSVPRIASFATSWGAPPAILAAIQDPGFRDPWMSRVDLENVPLGKILRSNEICPDEVVVHDPWYQRVCVKANVHYGGGVMLGRADTLMAGMSTIRPQSQGPLTDEEMATWQSLIPHLLLAVRLHARYTQLTQERNAAMALLEDMRLGAVLVNPMGKLVVANKKAQSLLQRTFAWLSWAGASLRAGRAAGTPSKRRSFAPGNRRTCQPQCAFLCTILRVAN